MGIKTSVFHINPSADFEVVWQNLEDAGCSLLYSDVDENSQQIFGHLPPEIKKQDLLEQYPEIFSIEDIELPEIDWESQWAVHGNYHEGFLNVDLRDYTETAFAKDQPTILKLKPGPGFGDLSHPTTRLVLKLMPSYVLNKNVVDVGCGSGILSLAAVSMGASTVHGIDIDEEALVHSEVNSQLNGMEAMIRFILPEGFQEIPHHPVVLMNMIQSEQQVAWASLSTFVSDVSFAVTSGILSEGREDYLQLCKQWGWQLIDELEEDGWLGFVFKVN